MNTWSNQHRSPPIPTIIRYLQSLKNHNLQLRSRSAQVGLPMLARVANGTIPLPPHDPLDQPHAPTQMHHFALHQEDGALRRRPQIGSVDGSAHMAFIPEVLARDGGHGQGGADVEDGGDGAAVQVAAAVAELARDKQLEGGQADIGGGRGDAG